MGIASYIIPILCALILHGGLLLLLIPHWFHQEDPYHKPPQYIQAQMIDLKSLSNQKNLHMPLTEEHDKKSEKEKKRDENEQQYKRKEAEKALAQQKKAADIKQKAVEEKQRKAADAQKLIKAKEQKVIENARKIAAEKEDAKNKEEADKKRKADARKEKAREAKVREEAARKKAVADKKRKDDAAKRKENDRKVAEKKRQQEKARLAAAERADKMRSDITGYIQALVEDNWRVPSTARNGMTATVLIRLFPSGEVDSVKILQSSGDAAFDKSTERAVLRVGRFTRVSEVDLRFFERELRQVKIEFRPKGLRW